MATYLYRTNSTSSNTYTFSAWVKHATVGTNDFKTMCLFGTEQDVSSTMSFSISDADKWNVYNGSAHNPSDAVARDPNAWYHVVLKVDNLSGTIYVNGESVKTGITCKATGTVSNHMVVGGYLASGNEDYFNGYMSHVAFVEGQALNPTVFGETDSTSGIWKFKSPSGVTWGTNGFHLKFENSGNLGLDSSGNGNNLTASGNLKQALDTPSNVYATLNPLSGAHTMAVNTTFSNGNNTVACSGTVYNPFGSTLGVSKGKWYAEFKTNNTPNDGMVGIFAKLGGSSNYLGSQTQQYVYYNQKFRSNSSDLATGLPSITTNDIIGMALDCDNNKLYYHKNGTYMTYGGGTMNPTSGTYGISITDPDDTDLGFYFMSAMDWGGTTRGNWSANFGNGFFGTTDISSAGSNGNGSLFEYDVPSGYYALNTKNINTYG